MKSPPNKYENQLKVDLHDNTAGSMGSAVFSVDSLGKVTKKSILKDNQGRELGDIFIEGKIITKNHRYGNRSMLDIEYSP